MSVNPLLLERLEPGMRVRADGDVIYVTEDLEVPDGVMGIVTSSWGYGASFVRWDSPYDQCVLLTSHDSLALVST